MIFEHKTEVIVMLTNLIEGGMVKCDRYYPENQESFNFGDVVTVTHVETIELDYCVIRKLCVHMRAVSWSMV